MVGCVHVLHKCIWWYRCSYNIICIPIVYVVVGVMQIVVVVEHHACI